MLEPSTAIAICETHLAEACRILEEVRSAAEKAGKPVRAGKVKEAMDAIVAARTVFKIFGHGLQDRELEQVISDLHDGVVYLNGRTFIINRPPTINLQTDMARITLEVIAKQ